MITEAFAKVNLTLDITGTDERGYHLLSSVFSEVSLCDTVTLSPTSPGTGLTMTCTEPGIPTDGRNLCIKAAQALLKGFDLPERDFRIDLVKRIPSCAGLGGGSSDAAAVLRLLCGYFKIDPADGNVARIALSVGADVPFFLKGGCCLAEGVGEKLTPLPALPDLSLAIVKTDEAASTPEIFRRYDEDPIPQPRKTPDFLSALRAGETVCPHVSNHLTTAASGLCPSVRRLKDELLALGALAAEMSGSGSAVYGLFPNETEAETALKNIDASFRTVCRFVQK